MLYRVWLGRRRPDVPTIICAREPNNSRKQAQETSLAASGSRTWLQQFSLETVKFGGGDIVTLLSTLPKAAPGEVPMGRWKRMHSRDHCAVLGSVLLVFWLSAGTAKPENIVFPANAGVINVTNAPYNAWGDGVHDDTAALQAALNAQCSGNKIRYLPNGTYLISTNLLWPGQNGVCAGSGNTEKRTILQGQSQSGVVIKLKDYAPGYSNVANPLPMIWTGAAPAQRFRNALRNLTLDIGIGNPGAIGLQFNASNQGTIRDVTIQSSDRGMYGLDFGYTDEIGPLLVRDLTVTGFGIGIRCANTVNSQTLEDVTLSGQTQCGIRNSGQVLNVRHLTFTGGVAAISNSAPGFTTVIDGTLTGNGNAFLVPAIVNSGAMFARNLSTTGFQISASEHRRHRPGRERQQPCGVQFARRQLCIPEPSGFLKSAGPRSSRRALG
jgi:Pectate lyase superfamily protein